MNTKRMPDTPKIETFFPILSIVYVALTARFLYAQVHKPDILMYPDSYGYYGLGMEMMASPKLSTIIAPYRTPLYPLFVAGTAILLGKSGAEVGSPDFQRIGSAIIVIQELIAVATLLLLYKTLASVDKNKRRVLLITLFFSVDPMLLAFERAMMTETITIFFSVLVPYASLRILMKPTHMNFFLLLASGVLGFLTRPAFLAIPMAAAPFLLWFFFRKKNRSAMGLVILTILSYLLVPILYSRINEHYYGYRGIQYVSDIAMLGRIIEFKISPEAGSDSTYLYDRVKQEQSLGLQRTAFEFIESFDPLFYQDREKRNLLHAFVLKVVAANRSAYIKHAIPYIPNMFFDTSPETGIPEGSTLPAALLFRFLWNAYRLIQYPTILIIGCFPFLLFWFFKKTKIATTLLVVCSTIVVTQVLITAGLVYHEDYGRLALIFRPHLFILFFYTVYYSLFLTHRSASSGNLVK